MFPLVNVPLSEENRISVGEFCDFQCSKIDLFLLANSTMITTIRGRGELHESSLICAALRLHLTVARFPKKVNFYKNNDNELIIKSFNVLLTLMGCPFTSVLGLLSCVLFLYFRLFQVFAVGSFQYRYRDILGRYCPKVIILLSWQR